MLKSISNMIPSALKTQKPIADKAPTLGQLMSKTTSVTDSMQSAGKGEASKINLAPVVTTDAPNAPVAPKTKSYVSQLQNGLKMVGKGLTCIAIAPLVGAWAVLSLAAVVVSPLIGSIVGPFSVRKEGFTTALVYAPLGFQGGLDLAAAKSKDMFIKLTNAVNLTK